MALEAEEYYFDRLALGGGRTEVRKLYYKGEMDCSDVHSMYPSIQIGESIDVLGETIPLLFPVGSPVIEIFDADYYPCNLHFQKPNEICSCSLALKMKHQAKKLQVVLESPLECSEDIHAYINNFDGILMVDVTPPRDMYHPLLSFRDPDSKKVIYGCQPLVCQTYASPLLKVAIKHGYVVTKIYRAHRYKMMPSKWKGLMGAMYKFKFYSSRDEKDISPEEKKVHRKYYDKMFDIDLDFTKCVRRPALKMSSKVLINSVWGKHAESVDHTQAAVFGNTDYVDADEFYNRIDKNQLKIQQYHNMGEDRTLFKYKTVRTYKDKVRRPDLHKGYLPCAVFVPMFGQLM